jgi:TolB-like protein/DNA-binding winged helix-turn-helix (wHTH) protein
MPVVRFGPFQLDLETHELFKHGRRVRLQENPCQILIALLERAGEIVTREELKRRLWPENSTVNFDRGLGTAMGKLRSALGESATKPLLIETVPRRGFRFVGVIEKGEEELRQGAESRSKGQTYSPEARPRRKAFGVLALLAVAALLAVVAYVFRPGQPAASAPSVAVLPLVNTSGEPELDDMARGITEALIDSLSQIGSLRVISRTSVMRYKDETKSLTQIAEELGVDTIVEGSVSLAGDRIRIAARLVDGEADRSLWSTRREEEVDDMLASADEIALEIAEALGVTPTPEERKKFRSTRSKK